jgi:hypothetical protein
VGERQSTQYTILMSDVPANERPLCVDLE